MKYPADFPTPPAWAIPVALLILGLALTAGAMRVARQAQAQEATAQFRRQADILEGEIIRRIRRAEDGLKGARAAWAMAGRFGETDLDTYVRSRHLERDFPGIRGIGLIERVERADADAFVRRQRKGGQPDYRIKFPSTEGDLYLVSRIAPLARNRAALGMDSGADPMRRTAIEAAIDSGQATLTGPFTLAQDEHRGLGWLVYLPVYRDGGVDGPRSRENLAGVLFAPIVAEEVLAPVIELASDLMRFRLFDGLSSERRLIFDSTGAGASTDEGALEVDRPIVVGERLLTLQFESSVALHASSPAAVPRIIGAVGAVLSLLLALSAWLLMSGRERAVRLAETMNVDLKRLAQIVERASGGVFTADPEGRLTWVNEGFEKLTGRTQETLLGSLVIEVLGLVESVDIEARRVLRRNLMAGLTQRLEVLVRRPDGAEVWVDAEVQPQFEPDGVARSYIGIALDIGPRKAAEKALQASEHLVRLITDNMPARISYWDAQRRCRFVNRRFCEVFGRSRESVLGCELSPALFGEEGYQRVLPHVEEVLNGMPQQFEHAAADALGHVAAWQIHFIPDIVEHDVAGFFVLAIEVTELKKARDLALSASQAKSRFLSSMSHEIRTPMNAILGMLTLLRGTPLDDRQHDYASKAEGAARSLLSLLNDILDFSKIEAGKMALDCRPFSVDELLRDLSVILSANVGTKDLEVLYEIDPRVPARLVGDDMRLRQILINLGGNAVKFTPSGEVVVQIRQIERRPDAVRLEVAVRDTGIGISPEEQQLLFHEYVQATGSTARQFGGTGLGLGICRKLTALMGSQLRLESEPGVGSRFSFELELPVPAAEAAPSAGPQPPVERVLIVDDNACARQTMAATAWSQGWEADTAEGGEQALALLEAASAAGQGYDAIFVDWRMPGLDGWETSLRIRQLPAAARAPLLVMVTAHGREMLSRRPEREQALLDGFLVKPVTSLMVREALARAVAGGAPPAAAAATAPVRALAGLQLLVAEDNPINQQIAVELLTAQGAQVTLAPNGEEAVALLAEGRQFDAVLMDVLMPVMDGLAATRYIRRQLGLASLPIVAMTANAMDGDRAECLASGMDDHVGKPFVLADVVAALLRQVQRAQPSPEPHAAGADGTEPAGWLDRDAAIARLGGDTALFDRLMPAFVTHLRSATQALAAVGEASAAAEVVRLVHTLKGMAGTMGAERLSAAAAQAEAALLDAQGRVRPEPVREVLEAMQQTLAAIG